LYNQVLPPSKLPTRNQNFIGRKEYLDQIDNALTKGNKQVIILSSFSGTGKSSIANETGHVFNDRSFNHFVYWMGSDKNNLDEEFRKFAFDLNVVTEDEKLKKPIEFIIKKIELEIKSNHLSEQFLFIFDNCDSIENTNQYLDLIIQDSTFKNLKFLITTTISSPFDKLKDYTRGCIRNYTQTFIIEPFNANESIEFIKTNLSNAVKNEELNQLINLLDFEKEKFRPTLLNKLIAWVKLKLKSTTNFKNIIDEFKEKGIKQAEILDEELFQDLVKKEAKAWKVMMNCSFLDPDLSPISIYTGLFEFEENELFDAADVLKELSLISIEEDDEGEEYGIKIHRSLQNETKKYLETEHFSDYNHTLIEQLKSLFGVFKEENKCNIWNKRKYYKNFKYIVENSFEQKNLNTDNLEILDEKSEQNSNENQITIENIKNSEIKVNLAEKFGYWLLNTNLDLINSIVYLEKSIEIKKQIFGTYENSSIVDTLNKIGKVLRTLGRHDEALENYTKSLEINRNIFGTDENSSSAGIFNNIAIVYITLGKYEEALENYSKSLEINRKIFGTDEHSY